MIDEENAMHYRNAHTLWLQEDCPHNQNYRDMVTHWSRLPRHIQHREWGQELSIPLDYMQAPVPKNKSHLKLVPNE